MFPNSCRSQDIYSNLQQINNFLYKRLLAGGFFLLTLWLTGWTRLCWEMETQILCGQQERGIRSGGPAEEWKEKVEQMPSFKFTRSLLGDLCSHGDKSTWLGSVMKSSGIIVNRQWTKKVLAISRATGQAVGDKDCERPWLRQGTKKNMF